MSSALPRYPCNGPCVRRSAPEGAITQSAPQLVANRFTGSAVLYGTPSTKNGIILTQNINTASSSVAKATDELASARDQLAGALALIAELDAQLDSPEPLAKGHGAKVADAQAQAQQLQRLVKRREDSLTDARAILAQAEEEVWTAKVNTLAEQVAAFDHEQFTAEFVAKVQPILDKHLEQVHEIKAAETELRSLAGKERHPSDRVSFTPDLHRDLIVDGDKVYPLAPQHLVKDLGSKLTDTRYDSSVAEALAEQRAAQAEERAEREAQYAENRRLTDAARGPAPAGARVSRDREGKEIWMRPATVHKAGHGNR